MLFNASQRKGIIVLIVLIVCLIVLPKQFLQSDHKLFVVNDTLTSSMMNQIKKNQKKQGMYGFLPYNPEIERMQNIKSFYQKKVTGYRQEIMDNIMQNIEIKQHNRSNNPVSIPSPSFSAFSLKDDLNEMSFKEMLRNPYLTYEDVKLVFEAKRKYHTISFSILESRKVLPADKLSAIKPYFK